MSTDYTVYITSLLQFLRVTVFCSHFYTGNIQLFTFSCLATEVSFWLTTKNLGTSFLGIHSILQRYVPLSMMKLLGITSDGNIASALYEGSETPVVADFS